MCNNYHAAEGFVPFVDRMSMLYSLLIASVVCRLGRIGFDTVSALTFTVQINYCATVLWAALDSYAPPGWNTYAPYVVELITASIASQMTSRVSSAMGIATVWHLARASP